MASSATPFLFLIPADSFSFVTSASASASTFAVSVIAASITSLLLSVVRHLVCVYGATVSRVDGVSSTDYLPREDGVVPLLQALRFAWRFGGLRRRPHLIVSLVGLVMLYLDAYAVSGVVANANCSEGRHAVVESETAAGMCLDADPAGNGDAQIGRAAAILDRQRALGFPIKGVPGSVSVDAEMQVYYPEDCGGQDCPAQGAEPTVAGCKASEWQSRNVEALLVSSNTSLTEFRLGRDDDYVPAGWPREADPAGVFTAVLGAPVGRAYGKDGKSRSQPIYVVAQTLRNSGSGAGRSADFLDFVADPSPLRLLSNFPICQAGYLDLTHEGFARPGEMFTVPEGESRLFKGPLRYREFSCDKVGEAPVIFITSRMLRDAAALRVRGDAADGKPCWEEGRERDCAPTLDDVYTAGLASLLGVGSACRVPLIRARTCTGVRRSTVGIVAAEALLALVLMCVLVPFYIQAKKRTGYWHHSVDKFIEVVAKTIDGTDYNPGFKNQRRPVWVKKPLRGKADLEAKWTIATDPTMPPGASLSQSPSQAGIPPATPPV